MSTQPHSYLAFDLGASSGRAVLGTLEDGRMGLREVHRFATPLIERAQHLCWDIETLWAQLCTGLEIAAREAPQLRSVSVDSWAVDYVPIDAGGRPLRDPYAYRDPRTRGRMAQALERIAAAELYRRTGIQLLEINTLYQLLADMDEEPQLVRRTAARLPIADYVLYRMSGRAVVERTMASTTQLMSIDGGIWDVELMRCLRLPVTGWPEIVAPGTVLGRVDARQWPGVAAPLVVASCSHDTACAVAAVPADVDGPAWAFLSSGTWSLLGVERHQPVLTDAARQANFTNEAGLDDTVRLLKNLTGLWVLQECERAWDAEGVAVNRTALLAEAAATPPRGLLDLDDPRLAERGDMPARLLACCRELGITLPPSRAALVQLIVHSLAASYARALRQLECITAQRIDVLHVVGGGSQNAPLCQLTADACACRVIAGPAEATALGNLLIQARTLGDLPPGRSIRDVARASSETREYHPAHVERP